MRESPYRQTTAGLTSLAIHVLGAALLLTLGTNDNVRRAVTRTVRLVTPVPDLAPLKAISMHGGGGGGDGSSLPASKGRLPRAALRQFTPPMAVVNNLNPKLIVEPTIIASPDANLPRIDLPEYGDPFGRVGPSSNGPGSGGGIGTGSRGGVGPGDGPGVGPGKNGGYGEEVFAIGSSVSAPVLIDKVEPEYSEEARKAKYQGTVNMEVVIDEKGRVVSLRVISSPGLGLDIKASEAVRLWRFRPGTRNGKPVAVSASVAVNFRLL